MKRASTPGALRSNRPITLAKVKRLREHRAQMIEANRLATRGFMRLPYPHLMPPEEVEFYEGFLKDFTARKAFAKAQRDERRRFAIEQDAPTITGLPSSDTTRGLLSRLAGSWRKWQ